MMDTFKYHNKSKFEVYAFSFGPEAKENFMTKLKVFYKIYKCEKSLDTDLIQLSKRN